ncbi:hypothetical protein WMF18_07515 [Sorangium sp. So ce315]|uniref:hypothetical protein n=1 Tax=Sorangium sp. So ce315 TaxID=3133299 RepID=UPI003F5EA70F
MNRQTRRTRRLAAHGASALLIASLIGAVQAAGCLRPDCEEKLRCDDPGPDVTPPDPPDAGQPDADTPDTGQPDSGSPDADPPKDPCVPSESTGPVDETCGVFVSVSLGSPEGTGTKSAPFSSLQEAIQRAAEPNGTGRVYACAGEGEQFSEVVEVPGGVTLHGGLDCNSDWRWLGGETKTELTADEGMIPLTMGGSSGTVRIEDLRVVAKSTAQQHEGAGLSSIAAVAHGTAVELVRCEIEAGDAAPGADGASVMERAGQGASGLPGLNACSRNDSSPVPGGLSVTNDCGTPGDTTDDSTGGRGGSGFPERGSAGEHGQPRDPANSAQENGGAGWSMLAPRCTPGLVGSNGAIGTPGAGATGPGAISMTGYAGVAGRSGDRGAPGQGGGGGGGARGEVGADLSTYVCRDGVAVDRGGASGGSGGAGGCGGQGGSGGFPGGASIALISIEATLSFEGVTLKAGAGGQGGNGGDGQLGGDGGQGGLGGEVASNHIGLSDGCPGGPGGRGGQGGNGGGGQGGHSLGIAFRGAPPPSDGVVIEHGAAGLGGNSDVPGSRGDNGIAGATRAFN